MSKLFEPLRLGKTELKNRVVMAPMTRSRALNNVPSDWTAEYYGQRADAGLIITEGTSPSPNGLGYSRIPGIFNSKQVEGWKKVTKAVHKKGGKIFVQLMHTGRVTHPDNLPEGAVVLAPSSVPLTSTTMWVDGKGNLEIPAAKEMTTEDIRLTIREHIEAAKNAVEAGFDGIEIHAANGYLIKQFINPHSNRRTDEYGGSIENRSRFLLEVAEGIANAIGKDKVGVRISPNVTYNETPLYDDADATYDYISKKLNDLDIAYLHVITFGTSPALNETIRENFKNTIIVAGDYNFEKAQSALTDFADLVAFGKPFIANPDLVKRLQKKLPYNQPKFELFYTAGTEGYIDYPVFNESAVLA